MPISFYTWRHSFFFWFWIRFVMINSSIQIYCYASLLSWHIILSSSTKFEDVNWSQITLSSTHQINEYYSSMYQANILLRKVSDKRLCGFFFFFIVVFSEHVLISGGVIVITDALRFSTKSLWVTRWLFLYHVQNLLQPKNKHMFLPLIRQTQVDL